MVLFVKQGRKLRRGEIREQVRDNRKNALYRRTRLEEIVRKVNEAEDDTDLPGELYTQIRNLEYELRMKAFEGIKKSYKLVNLDDFKVPSYAQALRNCAKLYNHLQGIIHHQELLKVNECKLDSEYHGIMETPIEMGSWHSSTGDVYRHSEQPREHRCGTSHCIAGWAQFEFDKHFRKVTMMRSLDKLLSERDYMFDVRFLETAKVGEIFVWPFSHLFHETSMNADRALEEMEAVLSTFGYEFRVTNTSRTFSHDWRDHA